jgi:hypothetical protein
MEFRLGCRSAVLSDLWYYWTLSNSGLSASGRPPTLHRRSLIDTLMPIGHSNPKEQRLGDLRKLTSNMTPLGEPQKKPALPQINICPKGAWRAPLVRVGQGRCCIMASVRVPWRHRRLISYLDASRRRPHHKTEPLRRSSEQQTIGVIVYPIDDRRKIKLASNIEPSP